MAYPQSGCVSCKVAEKGEWQGELGCASVEKVAKPVTSNVAMGLYNLLFWSSIIFLCSYLGPGVIKAIGLTGTEVVLFVSLTGIVAALFLFLRVVWKEEQAKFEEREQRKALEVKLVEQENATKSSNPNYMTSKF